MQIQRRLTRTWTGYDKFKKSLYLIASMNKLFVFIFVLFLLMGIGIIFEGMREEKKASPPQIVQEKCNIYLDKEQMKNYFLGNIKFDEKNLLDNGCGTVRIYPKT